MAGTSCDLIQSLQIRIEVRNLATGSEHFAGAASCVATFLQISHCRGEVFLGELFKEETLVPLSDRRDAEAVADDILIYGVCF